MFVCYFIYLSLLTSFLLETVILNLVILAMFTSYNCPPFGNAFVFLFCFFHKSDHFLFHYFLMSGSPLRAYTFALCSSFPAAFTPLRPRFYVGRLGGNFPLLCSDFLRTVKSGPLLFLFFFLPPLCYLCNVARNVSNDLCLNELQLPEPALGRRILRGGESLGGVSLDGQIHGSPQEPLHRVACGI